jgi:hypothetical protein
LTEAENLEREIEQPNTLGTAHSYVLTCVQGFLGRGGESGTRNRAAQHTRHSLQTSSENQGDCGQFIFSHFFTTIFRIWAGIVGYFFCSVVYFRIKWLPYSPLSVRDVDEVILNRIHKIFRLLFIKLFRENQKSLKFFVNDINKYLFLYLSSSLQKLDVYFLIVRVLC